MECFNKKKTHTERVYILKKLWSIFFVYISCSSNFKVDCLARYVRLSAFFVFFRKQCCPSLVIHCKLYVDKTKKTDDKYVNSIPNEFKTETTKIN